MDIEKYLSKFYKFTKDPTLDTMYFLMNEFGNPHTKCKFIHVAGTNGKGSICEMLSNILIKQGYRVGKYISPYLVRFNENISVNNVQISDKEVEEIINKYDKIYDIKTKWFEVITSTAFIYFASKECDFVVLETGIGGVIDPTNIVNSLISVIANIGYDHMDVLGNTIEEITKHKAGIIKENSDTVFFKQDNKNINDIISQTCNTKNNELHLLKEEDITQYSYGIDFQKFNYKEYKNVEINLKGKKQIYNASVCLECMDILKNKGYDVSDIAVREGLKTVIHKARFEILNESPTIIFDGGHNENAIINLKETINQYYKNENKVFIISILKTKDYRTILKLLLDDKDAIYIFTSGNDKDRFFSKEELYYEAIKYINNDNTLIMRELNEAIDLAAKEHKNRVIFIIGSFYVYKTVIEKIEEYK